MAPSFLVSGGGGAADQDVGVATGFSTSFGHVTRQRACGPVCDQVELWAIWNDDKVTMEEILESEALR